MPRKKKDALPNIDIDGTKFRVDGYGWYPRDEGWEKRNGIMYFVYNDSDVLDLPYGVTFKLCNPIVKIIPESGSGGKAQVGPIRKWKFYREMDGASEDPPGQEWIYSKKPLDFMTLLCIQDGLPMPPGPVHTEKVKNNAYKKKHGQDVVDIDAGKAIDICTYLFNWWHEDERHALWEELRSGRLLGYYLGDVILLLNLQRSDFEQVFDQGLIPKKVSYDKRSYKHTIIFSGAEGIHDRIYGGAHFLKTPASITKRYFNLTSQEDELRQTFGADDCADVSEDIAADGAEEPVNDAAQVDGEGANLNASDDCGREALGAVLKPPKLASSEREGTSLLKIPKVLSEARYWLFVYACRRVLNERAAGRKKSEIIFKNQDALIGEVLTLMREECIPEKYLLSVRRLMAVMKSAEAAGHMPDHRTGALKS